MNIIEQKVFDLIDPIAQSMGYEIVLLKLNKFEGNALQISLDKLDETGINISDCAKFSKEISPILEEHDPIPFAYFLEVGSSGINRPLTKLNHYHKFINNKVVLKTKIPVSVENNQKNFKGIIQSINGNIISLKQDDGSLIEINFDIIEKANLDLLSLKKQLGGKNVN